MNHSQELQWIDYLTMIIYFGFVLGIGFVLKRFMRTSSEFLTAGRSIPAWVAGLAFLSANLGAQEVIGMAASGAKYGIATSHFYWLGAIPAMVFVGIFMMPFYYGSKAHSVPDYLLLRFDKKTRSLNAMTFAVMTIMSSGISMYAMALLIQTLHIFDTPFQMLGLPNTWVFHVSIIISALIVLGYGVQQHYGYPAIGVRLRERAVVCHLFARNVLETLDRSWSILRIVERDRRRGRPPRLDHSRGQCTRDQRWLDRRCKHLFERDGPELLDGNLCLDDLFPRNHHYQLGHNTPSGQ
jgi:hypothetical protein